jgi:hypothetical protein
LIYNKHRGLIAKWHEIMIFSDSFSNGKTGGPSSRGVDRLRVHGSTVDQRAMRGHYGALELPGDGRGGLGGRGKAGSGLNGA